MPPAVKGVKPIVSHKNLVLCRHSRYLIGKLPSTKESECRLPAHLLDTQPPASSLQENESHPLILTPSMKNLMKEQTLNFCEHDKSITSVPVRAKNPGGSID